MTNPPNTPDQAGAAEDGPSTPMLDAATYGQPLDDNNETQPDDMMDDSQRTDRDQLAAANGPTPASADNLPRELTNPSDRAFTLPEEQ